jgi:hypothetical protein
VQKIQSDLSSNNFGDAQKQVVQIRVSYDSLASAVGALPAAQRETIAPLFDQLQGDVNMLNDVNSINGLRTRFQQAQPDLQSAQSTIQDALRCT